MQNYTKNEEIMTLLLPCQTRHYILPTVLVAEIIYIDTLMVTRNMPRWIIGKTRWRQIDVWVISLDLTPLDGAQPEFDNSRIVICHALNPENKEQYFGVCISKLPKLLRIQRTDIQWQEGKPASDFGRAVSVAGIPAILPNIAEISKKLLSPF